MEDDLLFCFESEPLEEDLEMNFRLEAPEAPPAPCLEPRPREVAPVCSEGEIPAAERTSPLAILSELEALLCREAPRTPSLEDLVFSPEKPVALSLEQPSVPQVAPSLEDELSALPIFVEEPPALISESLFAPRSQGGRAEWEMAEEEKRAWAPTPEEEMAEEEGLWAPTPEQERS